MADLSFLGPVVSGVSSIIGNLQSGKNVKKQIQAQQHENALNRQFNASEAQKNRDFQSAQIASYRDYNSPANQMKMMQDAGLHPMAALGQLGGIDPGTTSGAQASTSNSISPVGYQPLDMTATSQQLASARLMNAQADKAEADADLAEQQSITDQALRDGLVTLNNIEVEFKKGFNEKELQRLSKVIRQMDQDFEYSKELMNNIIAKTAGVRKDNLVKDLDYAFKSATQNARIQKEIAENKITQFQFKKMVAFYTYEIASMKADIDLKTQQAIQASSMGKYLDERSETEQSMRGINYNIAVDQHRRFRFDLQLDEDFSRIERTLGIESVAGKGVIDLLNGFSDAVDMYRSMRGRPRVGFRR